MYSRLANALILIGFISVLAGVYLLLGLPEALIAFGFPAIYAGIRIGRAEEQSYESSKAVISASTEIHPGQ